MGGVKPLDWTLIIFTQTTSYLARCHTHLELQKLFAPKLAAFLRTLDSVRFSTGYSLSISNIAGPRHQIQNRREIRYYEATPTYHAFTDLDLNSSFLGGYRCSMCCEIDPN